MSKDANLEKMEKLAAKLDAGEGGLLLSVKVKAAAAMQKDASKKNVDAYRAAATAWDEFQKRNNPAAADPEDFPNLPAVCAWLVEKGWKVSDSTLYNHKNEGKISPDAQGRYPRQRVVAYAEANLELLGVKPLGIEDIQRQSAEANLRIKNAKAEQEEINADVAKGKVMDWEQGKLVLAGRAAVLRADFRNLCPAIAPEIVELVGGDHAKIPALIRFLDERTAQYFDRYSKPETFVAEVWQL